MVTARGRLAALLSFEIRVIAFLRMRQSATFRCHLGRTAQRHKSAPPLASGSHVGLPSDSCSVAAGGRSRSDASHRA